jgi:hypothetical protein
LAEDTIRTIVGPLNSEIACVQKEWNTLLPEMTELAAELDIPRPLATVERLLGSLEQQTGRILERAPALYAALHDAIDAARNDRSELAAALRLHRMIRDSVAAATGAMTDAPEVLRDELERCRTMLNGSDLRELLTSRNWSGYRALARAIRQNIEILPELARVFVLSSIDRGSIAPIPANETDLERALRILRVPAQATQEEIQRAYRWLSSLWHPDRNLAASDEEMKAINWAYQYLKRPDGFARAAENSNGS